MRAVIAVLLATSVSPAWSQSIDLVRGSVERAPLADFESLLQANPGVQEESLGYSVSVSGNSVLAGAPDARDDAVNRLPGSAYVFVRGAGGSWTQQQRLLAAGGANRDFFGGAVSIDGDVAVVGAPLAPGGFNQGSVYIFNRTGSSWAQVQRIDAPIALADEFFGSSLALEGDVLVVGAPGRRNPQNLGNAYVFRRSGGIFALESELLPIGESAIPGYGAAVAISGTTAVVGSFADSTSAANAGAVFVFVKAGPSWPQQQKLFAPDAAANDFFGSSVSVAGNRLAVGVALDDKSAGADVGAAHVFTRTGVSWTHRTKLASSSPVENEDFGQSVALVGSDLHVGAFCQGLVPPPCVGPGAFYSFADAGTGYSALPRTVPISGQNGDLFGFALDASAEFIVSGAYRRDGNAGSDTGAVYVYRPQDRLLLDGFESP